MAKAAFGLSGDQAQTLGEVIAWWEQFGKPIPGAPSYRRRQLGAPVPFKFGKATEATSPDTGVANILEWHVSTAGVEEATTVDHEAYDWLEQGTTVGAKVHMWRHQQSGRLYYAKRSTGGGVSGSTTVVVVTDVDYDAAAHEFQKKTRTVTLQAISAESTWTEWHPMVASVPITEVDYTAGAKHAFQRKTTQVYVTETASESTFETWHAMVSDNVLIDQQISGKNYQQKATQHFLVEAGVDGAFTNWTTGTTCT